MNRSDSSKKKTAKLAPSPRKASAKAPAARLGRGVASKYAVAKIVLLGEAGVGKTALGWCLTGGKFSAHPTNHPMQFWLLKDPRIKLPDGTRCDLVLWDMASQPDYRLIHPLATADADLALIVFDPSLRTDTLRPVKYWLDHLADSQKKRCPTILVAARTEVGAPVLTKKEIDAFCKQHGVSGGYVATSAVTGEGLRELRQRIKARFRAGGVRHSEVTRSFHAIKDLVLELKQRRKGAIIFSPEQLLGRLRKAGVTNVGREDLLGVARRLAGYGYIRLIGVSEEERRILLVPELFDELAASFVNAARNHPQRLGVLEEESVLANDFKFRELRGLSDANQKSLLRSVVLAFLERNLTLRCLREVVDKKSLLFFPDLVSLKRPRAADGRKFFDGASYTVCGDIEYLFAVLVVTLGYTNMFSRTEHWDDTAIYEIADGVVCGFRIEDERERELDLVLFFSSDAVHPRTLLQGLVENFLARRKLSFTRYDPVVCDQCGQQFERRVVREMLQERKGRAHCFNCGTQRPLPKPVESSQLSRAEMRKVERQQWLLDQRRRFELAIFKVKEYAKAQKKLRPTCFISYAWGVPEHEQWVERFLAADLRRAGIEVLLDKWENDRTGASVLGFIDRIAWSDKIVVVGTPAYREKYENREAERGFVVAAEKKLMAPRVLGTDAEKESILPVLLAGEPKQSLPPWLLDSVTADFRNERDYATEAFDLILSVYDIPTNTPAMADERDALSSARAAAD